MALGDSLVFQYDGNGMLNDVHRQHGYNTTSDVRMNFWIFNSEGPAPDFPRDGNGLLLNPEKVKNDQQRKRVEKTVRILEETIPRAIVVLILSLTICVLYRRVARLTALTKKYEIEKGLLDQGPQNLKYRVLRSATKGFSSTELLGSGAFGFVYKGRLVLKEEKNPTQVAVKRISATSRQGAQEFLAEETSSVVRNTATS
ncbi:unnamed protein product [Calypogeia fissa]